MNQDFLMHYCVFNDFEDEDIGLKVNFNIGKSLVKKDIFKTLFGKLYRTFENRKYY